MLGVERAEVEADQLAFARRAAREYAATVLLKGRHTLVAAPDGRVRVTTTGYAVAGRRRRRRRARRALRGAARRRPRRRTTPAAVGSWLHGAAATLACGGGPLTAPDVAAALPEVVREPAALNGRMSGMASREPVRRTPRSWSTSARSGATSGGCATWWRPTAPT